MEEIRKGKGNEGLYKYVQAYPYGMISLPRLLHSVILPIEREKRENCGEREKGREGER